MEALWGHRSSPLPPHVFCSALHSVYYSGCPFSSPFFVCLSFLFVLVTLHPWLFRSSLRSLFLALAITASWVLFARFTARSKLQAHASVLPLSAVCPCCSAPRWFGGYSQGHFRTCHYRNSLSLSRVFSLFSVLSKLARLLPSF